MKATIEIPDALFRRAKSAAAAQGIPLKEFVSDALTEKLRERNSGKPWMKGFGKLRHLHEETARIAQIIEQEFERVKPSVPPQLIP